MADSTLATINPGPPINMPSSLDGLVLNVANGGLGDADTSYFYVGLGKDGYNVFSAQFTIQATTLTIEGSNDLPSVANGSAVWSDITNVVTATSAGGGVATITTSGTLTVSAPLVWSRLRFKRLTTNATNAFSLRLTRGRVN